MLKHSVPKVSSSKLKSGDGSVVSTIAQRPWGYRFKIFISCYKKKERMRREFSKIAREILSHCCGCLANFVTGNCAVKQGQICLKHSDWLKKLDLCGQICPSQNEEKFKIKKQFFVGPGLTGNFWMPEWHSVNLTECI